MTNHGFDKSLRLLNSSDYKTVFDDATLKVSNPNILILARANDKGHPRLGLVVAKKNAKLAVQRNRIKRIARESFRLQQDQMGNLDTIVLTRKGIDQLDNATLQQMFSQLWYQLQKKAKRQMAPKQERSDSRS